MNKLLNAITGFGSISFIQVIQNIDPDTLQNVIKAAIQVIIAIVTIWQLVRKKPS